MKSQLKLIILILSELIADIINLEHEERVVMDKE